MNTQEQIAAEQDRIQTARLYAWSSAPQGDVVCDGFRMLPLTFRALIDLRIGENPFVAGGNPPTRTDAVNYIWRVSDVYTTGGDMLEYKLLLEQSLATTSDAALVAYCDAHLELAFMDRPFEGGDGDTRKFPACDPVVSNIRDLCHICNITPDVALDWPLVKGFAMIRSHYCATDPKYQAPIPSRLNHLQMRALDEHQAHIDAARKEFE